MNHNYKLTDLKKKRECIDEINLKDICVTVCLRNPLELPSILQKRYEEQVNNLIAEREEKKGIIIPTEDIEVECCITVDTIEKKLYVEVYVAYAWDEELLHGKEVIDASNEHYSIIKKLYFYKLNDYLAEQIRRIEEAIE